MHLSRRVASRFLTETEKSGTGARFLNTDNVDHQFQVQSCGTGPDVRHLTFKLKLSEKHFYLHVNRFLKKIYIVDNCCFLYSQCAMLWMKFVFCYNAVLAKRVSFCLIWIRCFRLHIDRKKNNYTTNKEYKMHSLIDNPIICIPVLSILAIGPSSVSLKNLIYCCLLNFILS